MAYAAGSFSTYAALVKGMLRDDASQILTPEKLV